LLRVKCSVDARGEAGAMVLPGARGQNTRIRLENRGRAAIRAATISAESASMIDGLRQVRAFLAVARLRSFVRAANELHVSQPALTVQVQQLERTLGVKLLERNNRNVALTQAGEDILIPLERLLIDAESILGRGRDLAALRRGILTVAALPTMAATLLPAVLSEFCQAYPGISVRVRDDVAANFIDLVRSGDVDLGIGGQVPHDNAIFMQDLFADPICLFAPADHPVARKRSISLREAVALDVIMPGRNLSVRATLESGLQQQALTVRPIYETSHFSTAVGMVNAGLGVSILPHIAFACYPSTNIRCVPLINPAMERRMVIATKEGRQHAPAVERFREILKKQTSLYSASLAPLKLSRRSR
jgi:LysR family transcriptional regulator, carnitine catabolism transcriptional activator